MRFIALHGAFIGAFYRDVYIRRINAIQNCHLNTTENLLFIVNKHVLLFIVNNVHFHLQPFFFFTE